VERKHVNQIGIKKKEKIGWNRKMIERNRMPKHKTESRIKGIQKELTIETIKITVGKKANGKN
jgi:hypothetical protein